MTTAEESVVSSLVDMVNSRMRAVDAMYRQMDETDNKSAEHPDLNKRRDELVEMLASAIPDKAIVNNLPVEVRNAVCLFMAFSHVAGTTNWGDKSAFYTLLEGQQLVVRAAHEMSNRE